VYCWTRSAFVKTSLIVYSLEYKKEYLDRYIMCFIFGRIDRVLKSEHAVASSFPEENSKQLVRKSLKAYDELCI